MGTPVDSLDVVVSAEVSKASQQLDVMISKLRQMAVVADSTISSMKGFSRDIGRMADALQSVAKIKIPDFSAAVTQLAQLSKIDLKNLESKKIKLDIEVNGRDDVEQVRYSIQKALDDMKVDTDSISQKIVSQFGLKGKAANEVKRQMSNLMSDIANSYNGKKFDFSKFDLDGQMKSIVETISDYGSVIRANLDESLGGAMAEYKEFYDFFNDKDHKIFVSDNLKRGVGKTEYADLLRDGMRYITREKSKGIDLNSSWGELTDRFPSLLSKDTVNDAEQLVSVLENIRKVREQIKPVSIQELTGTDNKAAVSSVWSSVIEGIDNAGNKIEDSIKKAMQASNGKINLDLNINEDKIIQDIKNAVKRASTIKYDPVKVTLDVDTKNIQDAVSEKIQSFDAGSIPELSEGLQKIAGAMAQLNGLTFNNKGLNGTINAIKKLISTDISSFDPQIFGQITQAITSLGNAPDISANLNRFVASLAKLANAGSATGDAANALPTLASNLSDAIQAVSNAGSISEPINTFVQSVSKLANAGNKTGQTASQLGLLTQEVMKFFQAMSNAPQISSGTVAMTQALASLASVGGKVGEATNSVQGAFQKLGNAGTKALASLKNVASGIISAFKKISSGVSSVVKTTISAFSRIASGVTSVAKKMLSTFKSVGSGALSMAKSVVSSLTKIGHTSKGINTLTFSLKNLLRSLMPIMGIRQLFNWGKQAIEISSDLTEVQNIVNATFGDLRNKANEFASTSLWDFGMSEYTAKEISSRFQAMGTAMGLEASAVSKASDFLKEHSMLYGKAASSVADMSIEVTKLAADMASFYNVDQAEVAEALESIYTGQTRPLRAYGLDLTQATLQEWAMKNGIDANVEAMSQAEKTMLRYQYVMSNSAAAQGDYARTSMTWANQTRLLAQSFQVLGSTVGDVLINAFEPFLASLNNIMLQVISIVETIANALGSIFGWTVEISRGGVAGDFGGAAAIGLTGIGEAAGKAVIGLNDVQGVAEDTGEGLADANEDAKELRRTLLSFDELHLLDKDADKKGTEGSGSPGGGGGSPGGDAEGGIAQFVQTESLFDKYKSDIKNLEELGRYIGEALLKAMQSIDWDKIYAAASNFGKGLADFLNGLIGTPGLFDELGKTLADALNAVLHGLDSFGDTFDWSLFGKSLADGLNSFFENFDFGLLADTLSGWLNGIADALLAFAETVQWYKIGEKIGGFLKDALSMIDWQTIYAAAKEFGSGLAEFLNGLISPELFAIVGKSIAKALNTALYFLNSFGTTFNWQGFGDSLAAGLNSFFANFNFSLLSNTIATWVNGLVDTLKAFLEQGNWYSIGDYIGDAIKDTLEQIDWNDVYIAAKDFGGGLARFLNGLITTDVFSELSRTIVNCLNTALQVLNTFGSQFRWSEFGNSLASSVNTFFSSFNWNLSASTFSTFINGVFNALLAAVGTGGIQWGNIGAQISSYVRQALAGINWETAYQAVKEFGYGLARFMNRLLDVSTFSRLGETLGKTVRIVIGLVKEWVTAADFKSWGASLGAALNSFFNNIDFAEIGVTLDTFISKLVDFLVGLVDSGAFETFGEKLGQALQQVQWETHLASAGEAIVKALGDVLTGLASTPAGRFIEAFGAALIAVKLAGKLFSFVDDIATLLGGDRNTRILKEAMEKILGGAVGGAAETAAKKVGPLVKAIQEIGDVLDKTSTHIGSFAGVLLELAVPIAAIIAALDLLKYNFVDLPTMVHDTFEKISSDQGIGKVREILQSAATWLETFSKNLPGVAGPAVMAAFAALIGKVADLFDSEKNANDELSNMGTIIDTLKPLLTDELGQALFQVKEDLEDSNASTDVWAQTLSQFFIDAQVGADALETAYRNIGGSINTTTEEQKLMETVIQNVRDSEATMAAETQQHASEIENSYNTLKDALTNLQQAGIIPSEQHMEALLLTLDKSATSGDGAKEMLNNLLTEMENLSLPTEELIEIIGTNFPEAMQAASTSAGGMTTAVDSMVSEAQVAFETGSGSMTKYAEDTENSLSSAEASVETHSANINNALSTNLSEAEGNVSKSTSQMEKDVTGAMPSIDSATSKTMDAVGTTTLENWRRSSNAVVENIDAMKHATSVKLGEVVKNVETNSKNIYNHLVENFQKASDKIGTILSSMQSNLTTNFDGIIKKYDEVGTSIEKIFEELKTSVKASLDATSTNIKEVANEITNTFKEMGSSVKELFTSLNESVSKSMDDILNHIKTVAQNIADTFKEMGSSVKELFTSMNESVSKSMDDVLNHIKTVAQEVANAFKEMGSNVEKIFTSMKESINKSLTEILNKVKEITQNISTSFENMGTSVQKTFSTMEKNINSAVQSITKLFNNLKQQAGNTATGIVQKFTPIAGKIKDSLKNMYNIGSNALSQFTKGVRAATADLNNAVTNAANTVTRTMQSIMSTMYSLGQQAGNSFANGLRGVYIPTPHIRVAGYNSHPNGSGGTISTPYFGVSWYAKGGLPNTGEMFIANEKGPELIGKMGSKNVVANNIQITQGIKSAVIDGMMEVFMATSADQSNEKPYLINLTVKTQNDEVLARAVERGRLKRDERYNPSPAY